MSINGKNYDYESIGIDLDSGESIDVDEIVYLSRKKRFSKNIENKGVVVLNNDEYKQLIKYTGPIYSNKKPINITIAFGDDGEPTTVNKINIAITKYNFKNYSHVLHFIFF